MTLTETSRITELYLDGMTQREIASMLFTSHKTIWKALKRAGIKCRTAAPRNQTAEKNHQWKGSLAKYSACHSRQQRRYGKPQVCEICGATDDNRSYDWASLSSRYDDPENYRRMCRSCHWKLDETWRNFHQDKQIRLDL